MQQNNTENLQLASMRSRALAYVIDDFLITLIIMIIFWENIILVSGNIPGAKKSMVMIRPAVKKPKKVLKVDELVDFSVKAEPTTTEENK